MGRPSHEAKLRHLVLDYLAKALEGEPGEYPLDITTVSKALGLKSRTLLYKYGLDELIREAKQKHLAVTRKPKKYAHLIKRNQELLQQLEVLREHNHRLLAQIAVIEGNAAHLLVNPEDLYKPLPKPERSENKASSSNKFGSGDSHQGLSRFRKRR